MTLVVPTSIVDETITILQTAGRASVEQMVLWLGRRHGSEVEVLEALRPTQRVTRLSIQIPARGMAEIFDRIRATRLVVAAQVHAHPAEAFHSHADDHLAVIRHEGALSLVLPDFAFNTSVKSFKRDVAAFSLSALNTWQPVDITKTLVIR